MDERTRGTRFEELKPGDRIMVEQAVTVGAEKRIVTTKGTVIRTERAGQHPHFQRHFDDQIPCDMILLELPDGELTTVTMDDLTVLNRA